MPCDPKYNVDPVIRKGLQLVDEALLLIDDINQAFELGENLTDVFHLIRLLYPPFDPLQTVGKY